MEAVALIDEVQQVMHRLSAEERRVFTLRLQGHGLDEIAGQVRRSEGTVRRYLSRVRQELQQSGLGSFGA